MGPCFRMLLRRKEVLDLVLLNRLPWHTSWVTTMEVGRFSDTNMLQISVNADILSQSGGPCVCTQSNLCVSDTAYNHCVSQVRNDLVVSTAVISSISSLLMGFLANLPVSLAPGLGVNAYVRPRIRMRAKPSVITTNSLSLHIPLLDIMEVAL
jgi:hypothetical protein